MLSESDQLGAAISEFSVQILTSCAAAAILVLPLVIFATRLHEVNAKHGKLLYTRFGIISSVIVFMLIPLTAIAGMMNIGLAEHNVFVFALRGLTEPDAPSPGTLQPRPLEGQRAKHIVLVMDESTTPSAFSKFVLPGLSAELVQYGTTYSTGNCSAVSQALMRWGSNPGALAMSMTLVRRYPCGRSRGRLAYNTVLIDGQVTAKPQNYMRLAELALIDEFLPFQHGVDTDRLIAVELVRRLRIDTPQFIYIVKRGSHFPYVDNIPADQKSDVLSEADAYRRSVQSSTGAFFAELIARLPELRDTLVFYTSDHGQQFGGNSHHCSGDYPEEEFKVPMAIMGEQTELLEQLRRRADLLGRQSVAPESAKHGHRIHGLSEGVDGAVLVSVIERVFAGPSRSPLAG